MKRKYTKIMPDGSKQIMEEHDEAPAMSRQQLANKGQKGDTELAHVNRWEEELLKRLGGSGTTNPQTGLKQFFVNPITGKEEDVLNFPLDIMPTSTSTGTSGGTSTATNQAASGSQNQAQNESYSLGTTGSQNQAANQATSFANQNAQNTAQNQAQNTAQQQATSQGQTYGGLPEEYQQMLLKAIMPQLTGTAGDIGANYDEATGQALSGYQQQLNNTLKTTVPKVITELANRGILNSTEGQNILAQVISSATRDASSKGYETSMQNALLKANAPSVLSQIAQLGQTTYGTNQGQSTGVSQGTSVGTSQGTSSGASGSQSTGTSSGSSFGNQESKATGSSSGTSFGNSSGNSASTNFANTISQSSDPTTMYRAMADLIASMM